MMETSEDNLAAVTSGGTKPEMVRPAGCAGCAKWVALCVVLMALIAGVVAWKFSEEAAVMAKQAGTFLHEVADRLHTRSVEETFRERVTQAASSDGDVLELATVETEETFTRADSRSMLWETVHLGTTVAEIRVPVVYRYHLKLSDEWQIEISGDECRVLAPMLRPSLPPALRTDGMEKKSEAGWLRFNAAENLAVLERGLTPQIEKRAGDKRHLDMAREPSRRAVEQFVRKWMLEAHPDIARLRLLVTFPDEIDQTRQVLPGEGPGT